MMTGARGAARTSSHAQLSRHGVNCAPGGRERSVGQQGCGAVLGQHAARIAGADAPASVPMVRNAANDRRIATASCAPDFHGASQNARERGGGISPDTPPPMVPPRSANFSVVVVVAAAVSPFKRTCFATLGTPGLSITNSVIRKCGTA